MPRGKPIKPYNERVLDRVLIDYGQTQCHLWTGSKLVNGYGYVNPPNEEGNKGKQEYVHRWFYKYYNPDDDIEGLLICHSCDNRLCVRKEHLRKGTSQDNVDDMKERPKQKIFNSKLRPEDIPIIRERLAKGDKIKDIANDFNVKDRHTISEIKSGKTWAWVK